MEQKAKILIVDDDKILRGNIVRILKMKGYEVEAAEDGLQGLKKLETYNPALIVLDINMPNMGGIEFYHKIYFGDKPRYPVLFSTARSDLEHLFREFSIDGFIVKPFDLDDFVREVEIILKKRECVVEGPEQKIGQLLKNVYLAENDPAESGPIAVALLDAGYRVACAKSGSAVLELMMIDPPVLGLIKLGLVDVSGDLVVQRAHHMAKTSAVKFIVYEKGDSSRLTPVRERMRGKTGVTDLVEYATTLDLVRAVEAALA